MTRSWHLGGVERLCIVFIHKKIDFLCKIENSFEADNVRLVKVSVNFFCFVMSCTLVYEI